MSKTPPLTDRSRVIYGMRALGRHDLPESFVLESVTYTHVETVKHDFYAATGFYDSSSGERVVLKVGRTVDFAGVPLRWVGRYLRWRECRFYRKLGDLPNVPRLLGTVGVTGFVHEYVSGRPLSKDRPTPDGFFDQLVALLQTLHGRGVAYVDTNKPQNILIGDDDRPHLIDFQISFDRTEWGDWFLTRWLFRRAVQADLYHARKHQRRHRPDEMTPEQLQQSKKQSAVIRFHRAVTKPYFKIRRATLGRLRSSGRLLPEGSE